MGEYQQSDPIFIQQNIINNIKTKKEKLLREIEVLKMVKIKEQLAGVAALIGVLGAIGAGFIKYGEVMSKLDSLEAFNPDPMMQVIGDNKQDIAVLEKLYKY